MKAFRCIEFCLAAYAISLYQDVSSTKITLLKAADMFQPLARPYYHIDYAKTPISTSEASARQRTDNEEFQYRILNNGKQKYLCAVPNVTSVMTDTSSTAEQDESQRASQKGWELLKGLEGQCLYWMSGWWTYKFCYSDSITQFHALPPTPGTAIWPPREDPAAGVYLLGKRSTTKQTPDVSAGKDIAKFRTNGESKSLVIDYEKGSYCPIIGAQRKTEVQFQCVPTTNDRIAFVKEITSCRYMIVIQTARLCRDVAFQESNKDQGNSITCTPINDARSLPAPEIQTQQHDGAQGESVSESSELSDMQEETTLDKKIDQELAHLAFDKEPPKLTNLIRRKLAQNSPSHPGGKKPPAAISDAEKDKLAPAVEQANDIADQLEDGTLKVSGQSIFDKDNKDVEFQVELQDERGEPLGSVVMKVLDGAAVIELEDELAGLAAKQENLKVQEENKKASENLPEHVRANFERFVGHDEL